MNNEHILKNLRVLIRNATLKYTGEYVWQDVSLTEDFKTKYSEYLKQHNYSIEFFNSTAVITTSASRYIFVPNQWFVIASYAFGVYKELDLYKKYFKDVSDHLGKKTDKYAKQLRDSATVIDKNEFQEMAAKIVNIRASYASDKARAEAVERLWRFVNDYSWWSGQKTIDRTDFYISVILNMLNLVNVSQGYVADIVSAYANSYELGLLVKEPDGFTVNMTCNIENHEISKTNLYEENQSTDVNTIVAEAKANFGENLPSGRHLIKISSTNNLEIKYKK